MRIVIDSPPIAQCRPRFTKNGHVYDILEKKKKEISIKIKRFSDSEPIEGPISVRFIFAFKYPSTWPSHKKRLMEWVGAPYSYKPDIDNLEKFYLDCSNKILWKDDSQVCLIASKKIYSNKGFVIMDIEQERVCSALEEKIFSAISREDILELVSIGECIVNKAGIEDVSNYFKSLLHICKRLAKAKI